MTIFEGDWVLFFRRSAKSRTRRNRVDASHASLNYPYGRNRLPSRCHVREEILSILVGRGDKILRKIPRICLSVVEIFEEKIVRALGGFRPCSRFREVSTPFFLRSDVFRPRTKLYNIIPPVRFKRERIPRGKWQTAVLPLLVGGIIAFMTYFTWKRISFRMQRR